MVRALFREPSQSLDPVVAEQINRFGTFGTKRRHRHFEQAAWSLRRRKPNTGAEGHELSFFLAGLAGWNGVTRVRAARV